MTVSSAAWLFYSRGWGSSRWERGVWVVLGGDWWKPEYCELRLLQVCTSPLLTSIVSYKSRRWGSPCTASRRARFAPRGSGNLALRPRHGLASTSTSIRERPCILLRQDRALRCKVASRNGPAGHWRWYSSAPKNTGIITRKTAEWQKYRPEPEIQASEGAPNRPCSALESALGTTSRRWVTFVV